MAFKSFLYGFLSAVIARMLTADLGGLEGAIARTIVVILIPLGWYFLEKDLEKAIMPFFLGGFIASLLKLYCPPCLAFSHVVIPSFLFLYRLLHPSQGSSS
ncbi:MAG: hypothetical protein GXN92_02860 [Candidatus Micrarchaeota archaeon]|nr:hypothetical protein [Candidatus Micrarchaeota archaeon]